MGIILVNLRSLFLLGGFVVQKRPSRRKTEDLNRVLFIGTGGGNDVFSTTLAAMCLWKQGWRWDSCDIAGVLSPFHRHTGKKHANGVLRIVPSSKRFLIRKDTQTEIPFIDATVAKMIEQTDWYGCRHVYGLPLTGGTSLLTEIIRSYRYRYRHIILVDVGGDIFYSGRQDQHVLSPMFDAMVLRAYCDAGAEGFLFAAGLGTDGEIDPVSLTRSVRAYTRSRVRIRKPSWKQWGRLYRTWIKPVRPGRTVPMTLRMACCYPDEMQTINYRVRAHLGDRRWYYLFNQKILPEYCHYFYTMNPEHIENPFAVPCKNPLEWFHEAQVIRQHTNCEANLEFLQMPFGLIQFLTPSPLFDPLVRKKILQEGLRQFVEDGSCDEALLFPADWNDCSEFHDEFQTDTCCGLIHAAPR